VLHHKLEGCNINSCSVTHGNCSTVMYVAYANIQSSYFHPANERNHLCSQERWL